MARDITGLDGRDKGVGRVQGTKGYGASGVLGVWLEDGKWRARIGVDGRNIRLGRFTELSDAIAARRAAEKTYHGDYAAHLGANAER